MKKLLSLLIISFFVLACSDNGKKEFLTSSSQKAVIDISSKTISLNGVAIPDIYIEMEKSEDLLIKGLDESLRSMRTMGARELNIHIDSSEQFKMLYKAIATIGFSGYTNFKTAIGKNYNSIFEFNLPSRMRENISTKLPECYGDLLRLTKIRGGGVVKSRSSLMYNNSEEGSLHEIICSGKTDDSEKYRATQKLESIKKRKIDEYHSFAVEYVQDCQEQKIQGNCWKIESNDLVQPIYMLDGDLYSLLQILWNVNQKSIRKDKKIITFMFPEDITIAAILPTLRKTKDIGYYIQLAIANDAVWVQ